MSNKFIYQLFDSHAACDCILHLLCDCYVIGIQFTNETYI